MSELLEMQATDSELAALVGMSVRWVRDRAKDKTITRSAPNRYILAATVPALTAYLVGGDLADALDQAKLRRLSAMAELAELALAEKRGDVASVGEFKFAQGNAMAIIQQNLRNVPARSLLFRAEPDDGVFKDKLRLEINSALHQAKTDFQNMPSEAELNEQIEDEND